MTPKDNKIVKALVAFAWVDGKFDDPESDVISGMLQGFAASADDKAEIEAYAKEKRTLDDIPLDDIDAEGRELLLANAALLTRADGKVDEKEEQLLDELVLLLGFTGEDGKKIVESARDGALQLRSDSLVPQGKRPPNPPPSKR